MGHLRIGGLPRTKKWRDVIAAISDVSGAGGTFTDEIAEKTLDASKQILRKLPYDESVKSCFQFLVALAVSGQASDVKEAAQSLGINIEAQPTKLQLSKSLRDWLDKQSPLQGNPEFGNLARQATVDTLADWLNQHLTTPQLSLFAQSEDPYQPWRQASDGRGFCELSRTFFSNFIARYLKYFISRTASAQLQTLSARENFETAISRNVDNISQHAFETSKLVQSFSAGWFNRNAIGKMPSIAETEGFLRHSFEKIREEFRRVRETGQ